jgi:hypothetical protein
MAFIVCTPNRLWCSLKRALNGTLGNVESICEFHDQFDVWNSRRVSQLTTDFVIQFRRIAAFDAEL